MRRIAALPLAAALLLVACSDTSTPEDTGAAEDGTTEGEEDEDATIYTVTVNGDPVPVHRLDRFDTPVSFVRFDHVPEAAISVTTNKPYERYKLSPEHRGIATAVERADAGGNTLTFTVEASQYLVFQPQALERLLILIDPPEENPPRPGSDDVDDITEHGVDDTGATLETEAIQAAIDALEGTGRTLYFPPGTYLTGELWLRDGMTLYLADGAVLRGSDDLRDIVTGNGEGSTVEQCLHALVRAYGVTDSHIRGRGILDGNGTALRDADVPETKYNLLKIEESSNVTVDGVIALDSSFWNTIVYRSDEVEITNYKVINHYKSAGWNETDGVDFDNATNGRLSHALLYTGDDCMATKSDDIPDDYATPEGVTNYPADPTVSAEYVATSNVVHEDVVCFTNQAAAKIGTKTMGQEMHDIAFRDIDVVLCGRGLVIDNMDTATVRDISFERIDIEPLKPCDAVNFLVRAGTDWRYSEGVGTIENITASDVTLHDFSVPPLFRIEGRTDETADPPVVYPIGDIRFTNVVVNDEKLTADNVREAYRLVTHAADSITFE